MPNIKLNKIELNNLLTSIENRLDILSEVSIKYKGYLKDEFYQMQITMKKIHTALCYLHKEKITIELEQEDN